MFPTFDYMFQEKIRAFLPRRRDRFFQMKKSHDFLGSWFIVIICVFNMAFLAVVALINASVAFSLAVSKNTAESLLGVNAWTQVATLLYSMLFLMYFFGSFKLCCAKTRKVQRDKHYFCIIIFTSFLKKFYLT